MITMLVFGSCLANAQGVSVNTSGDDPDASAVLDVSSTTQGMLIPRMTAAQRGLIAAPATGLLVYQTDAPAGFYFYDGSSWTSLNSYTNVTTQGNTFNGPNQLIQGSASGYVPLANGGTNADLSATGGTGQYVKQLSAGAALTVGTIPYSDISGTPTLNFLPLAGGTMTDGANIATGTTTGMKIGTATSQRVGFYNATPVAQPSGNIITALSNLGLVSGGSLSASDIPSLSSTYLPIAGGTMTGSINESQGTDIASAATTNIGAATGNYVNVTGTTTITSLGTVVAGTRRVVTFTGALTLAHNATSLILPGAVNTLTSAGDVATFVSLGSGNWRCVNYQRAGAILETQGADIISAATTNIAAATGNYVNVTGTTTITSFGTAQAGARRIVNFVSAGLTITHNATSLILPGAVSIITSAGDVGEFISLGSGNWKCVAYQKSTVTPAPFMQSGSIQTSFTSTSIYYPFGTSQGVGTVMNPGKTLANIVQAQTMVPVGFVITSMTVAFVPQTTFFASGAPQFALTDNGVVTTLTNTWPSTTFAANTYNVVTVTPATPVTVTTSSRLSILWNPTGSANNTNVQYTFYGHW